MFICDDCLKKYKNDKSLFRSIGNCEICGEHHDCNDIRSSQLIPVKEEVKEKQRVITKTAEMAANQYVGKPLDFYWSDEEQYHLPHLYKEYKAYLAGCQKVYDDNRYLAGL